MKLGIVDTMFARIDMGEIAIKEIEENYDDVGIVRRTVPGIKDLAVECQNILEECDICLALGMVGAAGIDKQCAHEASLGIQKAKLNTGKHIVEAFIHQREGKNKEELKRIVKDRVEKHAKNAVLLVKDPSKLEERAGKGVRQGMSDAGEIGKDVVGVVVAKFNRKLTRRMERKCVDILEERGVDYKVVQVPGSYEAPLATKRLLNECSGVITLGAVIKGDTSHDEVIVKSISNHLTDLSLKFNKPVTLGIMGHNCSGEEAKERVEEYAKRSTLGLLEMIEWMK